MNFPDADRSSKQVTTSDRSQSQLAKPLFATLICAGYVYLAVFFFFMFASVHSTPG